MNLKKGNEMEMIFSVFIVCVFMMFGAMWIYSKKENTAYHQTLSLVNALQTKIKAQEDLLNSNISTVAGWTKRIKDYEDQVVNFKGVVSKGQEEIDKLQDHCAKLRESQIQTKDMVSGKRPVVKVVLPIEFIQKAKSGAKKMKEMGL